MYNQSPPVSVACCQRSKSMNILQYCLSKFCCRIYPGYTCNVLFSQSLQHQKCCMAFARNSVGHEAAALDLSLWVFKDKEPSKTFKVQMKCCFFYSRI